MGADSVRAILDGRKTQTRRVANSRIFIEIDNGNEPPIFQDSPNFGEALMKYGRYPYGYIGDRLWVRETWGTGCRPDPYRGWVDGIEYKADEEYLDGIESLPLRVIDDQDLVKYDRDGWNSPMYMPRWASRITLEVTDIRIERVQDISEDDAIAEGILSKYEHNGNTMLMCEKIYKAFPNREGGFRKARDAYRTLWDSLNAKRGYPWESNPWVWVISFKQIHNQKKDV
jgi:hypothetical protein